MPEPNPRLSDEVVLLLVSGMSLARVRSYLHDQRDVKPPDADHIIAEARKRITVAADYVRDEQLGKAVMRLEELYAKSVASKDTRTALQAQRELNRLVGLYAPREAAVAAAGTEESGRLDLIAQYVLPLKLIPDTYPLEEHVRVACEIIRASRPRVPEGA